VVSLHSGKCLGFLPWFLITVLVLVFAHTANGMERKTPKPCIKGISRAEAEVIARKAVRAHFKKWDLSFDSVFIRPCDLVQRLDSSFNATYLFLISCEGKDTSLHGKIYVDSLKGSVAPFSAGFFPIHPESPITLNSYYDRAFPTDVFRKLKPGQALPHIWSLVCITYNTGGYSIMVGRSKAYPIRGGWGCPVWWGTDADGNDYFIPPNGRLFRIFDLDPNLKRRHGHPTKRKG